MNAKDELIASIRCEIHKLSTQTAGWEKSIASTQSAIEANKALATKLAAKLAWAESLPEPPS